MTVYGVTELSRFRTNGSVNGTRVFFSHYSYAFALEAINHRSKGKLSKVSMWRAIFHLCYGSTYVEEDD